MTRYKKISPKDGGRKIVENVLKRHPDRLKLSKTKSISSARKNSDIIDSIERYINALDKDNSDKRYKPFQQIVYDEFICSVNSSRSSLKRYPAETKQRAITLEVKVAKLLRYVYFVQRMVASYFVW